MYSTTNNMHNNLSYLEKVYDVDTISDYRKFQEGRKLNLHEQNNSDLIQKALEEMLSFGSDTWWHSSDPEIVVWYSLFEAKSKLVSQNRLIHCIEQVLGRTVFSFELRYGFIHRLKAELEHKLMRSWWIQVKLRADLIRSALNFF